MPGRRKLSSLLTGIPSIHLHRLIIPDDVLIQFDLLMVSTVMLETFLFVSLALQPTVGVFSQPGSGI
jgi:hypothetical protein